LRAPEACGLCQTAIVQRRVGNDGNVVLLAIGQQVAFDATLVQIIQNLVGDNRVFCHYRLGGAQFPQREVTHANVFHLPCIHQRFHDTHSLLNGDLTIGPVNLIQVDNIGAQPT